MSSPTLTLKLLTPNELESFKILLGGSEFGGCFCAVWASHDETWADRCRDPMQPNFAITEQRVLKGEAVGFLVYRGNELVGWTGSGPKVRFPFLQKKLGSRLSPQAAGAWAIGCIALKKEARGAGLAEKVVGAIIQYARNQGASSIESYPTRPWDEARSFRGSEKLYLRLGFKEVTKETDDASEILVMRFSY